VFHCAFRDVIRQLRIFFAIGLNERLCSRERFLRISEAGKMLVNEGVYVAVRRSSCADCFLDFLTASFDAGFLARSTVLRDLGMTGFWAMSF